MYNQHRLPIIPNTVPAITTNNPVSAKFYYSRSKCIVNFLQGKSFDRFKLVVMTLACSAWSVLITVHFAREAELFSSFTQQHFFYGSF